MEWFSRKTPIAGTEIPNWMIVLGAIIIRIQRTLNGPGFAYVL